MHVKKIITNRRFAKQVYWQIVYEWEDVIAEKMGLGLSNNLLNLLRRRYIRKVWHKIISKEDKDVPVTHSNSIAFVMRPGFWDANICNKKNVVPIIIDFWYSSEDEFKTFANMYSGNPAVIVTSKEVYEVLQKKCPNLKVFHWPLSIPDIWLDQSYARQARIWDCVLVGRPNAVMNDWVRQYAASHKDFTYLYNDRAPNVQCNYVSSNGDVLGDVLGDRKSYFELLRSAKIGLYSTPSMDNSRLQYKGADSNGYNQVTPRFFEYLAAGCHVIARYPDNPDTEYFAVKDIVPHTETYHEFERKMDWMRSHEVDMKRNMQYLTLHKTSARIDELKNILEQI